VAEYVQVYDREVSAVTEARAAEARRKVVVEEIVIEKEDKKLPEQKTVLPEREREDDWFLLLDVVSKEASYVPPGTHILDMSAFEYQDVKED